MRNTVETMSVVLLNIPLLFSPELQWPYRYAEPSCPIHWWPEFFSVTASWDLSVIMAFLFPFQLNSFVCESTKMQAVAHAQESCVPLTYALCAVLHLRFWHELSVSVIGVGFPLDVQKQAKTFPKSGGKPRASGAQPRSPFLSPELCSSFVRRKIPLPNAPLLQT